MAYCAMHHVSVNGKLFTPGEIVTEKLTDEQVARLMSKGALKMIGAPSVIPVPESPADTNDSENVDDEELLVAEEDEDEEEEAPVIDVTGSVIPAPAQEAEPKKTTKGGRKK